MRIESLELIDMGANGRVIHQQDYFDHDEALEAVGLLK
jgi:hypothetical protein